MMDNSNESKTKIKVISSSRIYFSYHISFQKKNQNAVWIIVTVEHFLSPFLYLSVKVLTNTIYTVYTKFVIEYVFK